MTPLCLLIGHSARILCRAYARQMQLLEAL
jgi:hypothetical protein